MLQWQQADNGVHSYGNCYRLFNVGPECKMRFDLNSVVCKPYRPENATLHNQHRHKPIQSHTPQSLGEKRAKYQSQKSLTRQFDLSRRFTLAVSSPRNADGASFTKLDFLFDIGVWTGAVMREMNTCKGSRTEVFVALRCIVQ